MSFRSGHEGTFSLWSKVLKIIVYNIDLAQEAENNILYNSGSLLGKWIFGSNLCISFPSEAHLNMHNSICINISVCLIHSDRPLTNLWMIPFTDSGSISHSSQLETEKNVKVFSLEFQQIKSTIFMISWKKERILQFLQKRAAKQQIKSNISQIATLPLMSASSHKSPNSTRIPR